MNEQGHCPQVFWFAAKITISLPSKNSGKSSDYTNVALTCSWKQLTGKAIQFAKRKTLQALVDLTNYACSEENGMPTKKMETPAKVQVDMEKSLRVSKKILDLLQKRTKTSAEAYFAVRLVGIFLEEKLGFKMTPEQEDQLRKLWRKDTEASDKGLTN